MLAQAVLFTLPRVAHLTASSRVVFMGAAAITARLLVSGHDPRPVDVVRFLCGGRRGTARGTHLHDRGDVSRPGPAASDRLVGASADLERKTLELQPRCALAGAEDEEEDLIDDTDLWPTERTLMRPEP
jgi:hypothetical protein